MSLEQTLVEAGKDFTVLPCEYHKLGEREQDYFTRLQAYQAPWLAERILGRVCLLLNLLVLLMNLRDTRLYLPFLINYWGW